MNNSTLALVAAIVLPLLAGRADAQIENGSFETGDFTGWETTDLEAPLLDLEVETLGALGYFGTDSEPTDGEFNVVNGFEGDGPGVISITQDVTVPATAPILLLDYLAVWDMFEIADTSTLDRTFTVVVQPVDGGEPLGSVEVLRALAQTIDLSGDRVIAAVNLSEFAGQDVQLGLEWYVPEELTGPAFFNLDNLRLAGKKLPALEKAALKLNLHFVVEDHDTLKFDMIVPVPVDFDPDGEDVSITVGGVDREFTLDATGKGVDESDSIKLLPVAGEDGYRKLKLTCKMGDFAFDFDGMDDETTGPGGVTALVPVSVELAGETIERELVAIWKATEEVGGKASAKAASDVWTTALTVAIDLSQPDHDSLKLKTATFVEAGFDPDGTEVSVEIGGVTKTFELDEHGQAVDGDDSLALVRDKTNAARQVVTLNCKLGDFTDVSESFTDEDTPAGGVEVQLPVSVTIDGQETRAIVPVTYKAKAGKTGKAKS